MMKLAARLFCIASFLFSFRHCVYSLSISNLGIDFLFVYTFVAVAFSVSLIENAMVG